MRKIVTFPDKRDNQSREIMGNILALSFHRSTLKPTKFTFGITFWAFVEKILSIFIVMVAFKMDFARTTHRAFNIFFKPDRSIAYRTYL